MTHNIEWRDQQKEWVDDHPGWYEHKIPAANEFSTQYEFVVWYQGILDWLYSNIDNCERHCRWMFDDMAIYIKFRHEKDYLLCALRW